MLTLYSIRMISFVYNKLGPSIKVKFLTLVIQSRSTFCRSYLVLGYEMFIDSSWMAVISSSICSRSSMPNESGQTVAPYLLYSLFRVDFTGTFLLLLSSTTR